MPSDRRRTVSALRPDKKYGKAPERKVLESKLAMLREKHGLRLRTVAEHSGVSAATVNRAERGWLVDLRTALLLARFFECKVDDIWRLP